MTKESTAEFQRDMVEQTDQHLHPSDPEKDIRKARILQVAQAFIKEPGAILDIGCQDGKLLDRFKAGRKVGMDISPKVLEAAGKKGIETVVFNIDGGEPFPFGDGEFDVVCSFDTIEHCIRTDHVVNEINRIMREGGLLISSVPNVNTLGSLCFYLMDYPPASSARYRCNHYRDFTHRTFKGMLEVHGFEIVRSEASCIRPFTGPVSVALAKWFPRLGETLIFVARKKKSVSIPDGYCATTKDLKQFFKEHR